MVPPVDPKVAEEVEVAARRGSSKDPELFAAQKIVVALEDLDIEQQSRVLSYIQSRINGELAKQRIVEIEKHHAMFEKNEKMAGPVAVQLRGANAVVDRQPLAAIAPSSF